VRRLFNQVFFKKLYVEDADTISSELAKPFSVLLPAASPNTAEDSINDNTPKERVLGGVSRTWEALKALGVKQPNLVAGAGFEPATSGL
jgi:hypothetical protein